MSCSLYNNNGYGCGGCVHFVKTNSVTLTDGVLILNIPQETFVNKQNNYMRNCGNSVQIMV